MGGLVSGIWGLMNGDPAGAQESQLGQLGGYETNIGETGTTAAMNYDLGILSGDPTKESMTLAPEIRTQQESEQQAKNQLGNFGNRGGGTAAATENMDLAGRGNIISLLGQEQSGAASNAGSLGTSNLGMATTDINDVANLKSKQYDREKANVGGIASGAGEIASAFSGGFGGGGDIPTLADQPTSGPAAASVAAPDPSSIGASYQMPDFSSYDYGG
jgi:hypothetical protein